MVELDLIGEWSESSPEPSTSAWLVQVRYTEKGMGIAAIKKFLRQVQLMKAKKGYTQGAGSTKVVSWYVCKGGFTKEAAQALAQEGGCSSIASFCALSNHELKSVVVIISTGSRRPLNGQTVK
jgi:hypothetical protein